MRVKNIFDLQKSQNTKIKQKGLYAIVAVAVGQNGVPLIKRSTKCTWPTAQNFKDGKVFSRRIWNE